MVIPGDTGPYDVPALNVAVGDAAARYFDPVDWARTAYECTQGTCSAGDILLAALPLANKGMRNVANLAQALHYAQTAGRWVQRSESMSDAARAYQRFISGRTDDMVFELGGYTFDGFDATAGILKDAKNIPENFINSAGEFKPWVTGTDGWLQQAQHQISAAGGLRVKWYFNSQATRDAMEKLFLAKNPDLLKSMDLVYQAMP